MAPHKIYILHNAPHGEFSGSALLVYQPLIGSFLPSFVVILLLSFSSNLICIWCPNKSAFVLIYDLVFGCIWKMVFERCYFG